MVIFGASGLSLVSPELFRNSVSSQHPSILTSASKSPCTGKDFALKDSILTLSAARCKRYKFKGKKKKNTGSEGSAFCKYLAESANVNDMEMIWIGMIILLKCWLLPELATVDGMPFIAIYYTFQVYGLIPYCITFAHCLL